MVKCLHRGHKRCDSIQFSIQFSIYFHIGVYMETKQLNLQVQFSNNIKHGGLFRSQKGPEVKCLRTTNDREEWINGIYRAVKWFQRNLVLIQHWMGCANNRICIPLSLSVRTKSFECGVVVKINNNNVDLYSARIHQLSGAQGALLTPAHKAHTSFLKPSQLPGEYTAQLLPLQRI